MLNGGIFRPRIARIKRILVGWRLDHFSAKNDRYLLPATVEDHATARIALEPLWAPLSCAGLKRLNPSRRSSVRAVTDE